MTDETPIPPEFSTGTTPDQNPDRHRIEADTARKRTDRLPVLYLVGFLILGGALLWLWQNPVTPRSSALEAAHVEALRQQVETLTAHMAQLEGRPAPAAPSVAPAVNAALAPVVARLAALEAHAASGGPDLGALQQRIDTTGAALSRRLDAIEARLDAAETSGKQAAASVGVAADQAQRAVRMQAVSAALDAGQNLGPLPGAPPALARFTAAAPPTMASLRLSFTAAAQAAQAASRPDASADKPFLTRTWARMQQVVTVRQGDKVLVGNAAAGIIEHARMLLDAGDLAGAVHVLDGLQPEAKSGMTAWMAQARSLVEARAALAEMARG